MRIIWICLAFWSLLVLVQCGEKKEETDIYEGMDFRTKIRLRQYMVQGKGLYQMHCQNCHGDDGNGLGELIPPLAKADYLINDIERAICLTRNGQNGSIEVNGKEYNQPMPPHKDLSALEIAEIITFVSNHWGNKTGLHDVKLVEKVLQQCAD